jgi:hypothetical protein
MAYLLVKALNAPRLSSVFRRSRGLGSRCERVVCVSKLDCDLLCYGMFS